jgi:hypothetical protein
VLFAGDFGLLPALAVSATATQAAAVDATSSAGSRPPAGLERRLRLSTLRATQRESYWLIQEEANLLGSLLVWRIFFLL